MEVNCPGFMMFHNPYIVVHTMPFGHLAKKRMQHTLLDLVGGMELFTRYRQCDELNPRSELSVGIDIEYGFGL